MRSFTFDVMWRAFNLKPLRPHELFFFVSAMVVRFITRRFIGEYDPNLEKIYSFSTIIDNEMVLFEILDAAGQLNVSKLLSISKLEWRN